MGKLVGLMLFVVVVVGGGYVLTHQGQSRTVTTPSAPNVNGARDAGAHAVATGDAWYQTHAGQVGAVLAFLIVGGLVWAIWTKLGKGWLIALALVILALLGALKVGG